MTEELQKKAEDFIIERYKIVKCYREDNAETREYMRMDVHSQYEEEYQLYLAATKELQEENAELKKWQKDTIKARGNDYMAWSRQNDQLTKARCIIASFVKANTVFDLINIKAEAENFLKESEVVK